MIIEKKHFEEATEVLVRTLEVATKNTDRPIAGSSALLIIRAIEEFSLKSRFRSLMDKRSNVRFVHKFQEFLESYKALLRKEETATDQAKRYLIFAEPEIPEVFDTEAGEEAITLLRETMTVEILDRIRTALFQETYEAMNRTHHARTCGENISKNQFNAAYVELSESRARW